MPLSIYLLLPTFIYEFSHESVLSWSYLTSSHFPLNLHFLRTTLFEFISQMKPFTWLYLFFMKATSGNTILANSCMQICFYHLCLWGHICPEVLTLLIQSSLFWWLYLFIFSALKWMRSSKQYQKIFKKHARCCAFSMNTPSGKSHIKINGLFPTANKYLVPFVRRRHTHCLWKSSKVLQTEDF